MNGTAPASDATATSRSRVTAKAAGRRPLRSTSAPTRRPSANTIAAGPSHGARKPGRPPPERRDVGMRRAAQRRAPRGSPSSSAGVEVPAGRRQQLERLVERQRVGAVRRQQRAGREQRRAAIPVAAGSAGPAADLLAVAADRVDLAVVGDRAERLGEPPDRLRVRRVALVEERVADGAAGAAGPGTARPGGRRRRGPCRRSSAHEADGTDSSASRPPAARAAVSSRRRATTSRRSKASSVIGRGSSVAARRARDDRLGERRPRRGGRAPERVGSTGTVAPADDRQAGRREGRLDERPRAALGGRGRAAGTATRSPGRAAAASPAEERQDGPVERQRPRPRRRSIRRRPRTRRDGPAPPGRPSASGRTRSEAPPAGIRDEPDAARVVLEARRRRAERRLRRGDGDPGTGSRAMLREGMDGPPSKLADGGPSGRSATADRATGLAGQAW